MRIQEAVAGPYRKDRPRFVTFAPTLACVGEEGSGVSEGLRASEAPLRARPAELAEGASFLLDATGLVASWDAGAECLLGYRTEEVLGRPVACLYPADAARAGAHEGELRAAASRDRYEGEGERVRKDGTRFPARVALEAVRDPAGEVKGFVMALTDLTGRKRAEEALALRGQALEALAEGVFILDLTRPGQPLADANPALEVQTGYAPAELIGQSYRLFQGPESDPATFAAIEAACRECRDWSGEVFAYRRDGSGAWYELRLVPVPDACGRVRHAVGVQTDITEYKGLQERLQEAQKMAALGWVTAGVAHDFNNLVTAIVGFCEILLQGAGPGSPRETIEMIKKTGQRGETMIAQLKAFCRHQQPRPEAINLRTAVSDMEGMLRLLLGEKRALATVADPALELVWAVPGQVEQVVLNLVLNARDAMPSGGTVTVELANADLDVRRFPNLAHARPGPYVLLAVTDTGCGMTEEVLAKLFQPLFSTKGPGKGSGLGLFTVKDIVDRHGGLIAVASAPGKGTRVEVFLPRAEPGAEGESIPAGPATGAGTETVLVVEGERGVRELIRQTLLRHGYTVLEAGDVGEAEALCGRHADPLHLLIADATRPETGAAELAARLTLTRPGLRVLYLSDHPPEAGEPYLPKPFQLDTLPLKVREVLDRGE